jgi:NADH-quinone oxidoreductase subunit J
MSLLLLAAIDWHATFFLLYALLACGFALAMLATSNIVRMAFYLTLSLGATAGLFFLAGAEFLGAMQLMIYVGGTLVLLIFGVMLTAQDRFISMKTGAGEWVLGGIVGASLLLLLLRSGFSVESWTHPRADRENIAMADAHTTAPIGLALSGVRVDKLDAHNQRLAHGMSGYLMPFVVISMHLLIVLIGAGYMARSKRAAKGVYTDRSVATQPKVRPRRRFAVTAGIVSGIIVNAVLAVFCFAVAMQDRSATVPQEGLGKLLNQVVVWSEAAPNWFWPVMGLLFLVNILLLIVVHFWQRWGVVGLVAIPLLQAVLILNANLGVLPAVALLVVALGPVLLLITLLNASPQPTLWSQMD